LVGPNEPTANTSTTVTPSAVLFISPPARPRSCTDTRGSA